MTVCTFVLDNGSFSMTIRTGGLALHDAKKTLSCGNYHTCSVASRACFHFAIRTSASVAMLAYYIILDFEFLGSTINNFLQIQLYTQTLIPTSIYRFLMASTSSAKAPKTSKSSASEDVSESREYVINI